MKYIFRIDTFPITIVNTIMFDYIILKLILKIKLNFKWLYKADTLKLS